MFRALRLWSASLLAVLHALRELLVDIRQELAVRSAPELEGRVSELERSRALWEAEVEGVLRKAEGERRQARAAEERTRHRARALGSLDDDADELEGVPEEYAKLLRGDHAAESNGTRVPDVRPPVGASRKDQKAHATRMKFGG